MWLLFGSYVDNNHIISRKIPTSCNNDTTIIPQKTTNKQVKLRKKSSQLCFFSHSYVTDQTCMQDGSKLNTVQKKTAFFFACVLETACKITYSLCCCNKIGGDLPLVDMRNVNLVPFFSGRFNALQGQRQTLNHVIRNT